MDEVSEISIEQLAALAFKNKWFIVLSAVLGLLAAFALSMFVFEKKYESSVKLYVYTPPSEQQSPSVDMNALNYAQKVVNTYIEMLSTRKFRNKIIEETQLDYGEEDLRKMIKFETLNQTEVFMVTVTSPKPEHSHDIANAINSLAPVTISEIEESARLKNVDEAVFDDAPVSPNFRINIIIGVIAGLGVSVLIVFFKDLFDNKIKNGEDVANKYGLNILAEIADISKLERTKG
ncbi:MAG: hypothetical protein LBL35_01230 [Clostridiales bacterium]|jgi:capsular polysaccharide biosynthesis protein|nr:hypothetical protein [Clostridiales bacterium]